MKQLLFSLLGLLICFTGMAQSDTTKPQTADTIKVGNMIIIKRHDGKEKKEDKTEEGTNGLGQVQYFVHPNSEESMGELEMNELDRIQKQIQDSAMKYNQVNGIEEDLLNGEAMGAVEPSEKIY